MTKRPPVIGSGEAWRHVFDEQADGPGRIIRQAGIGPTPHLLSREIQIRLRPMSSPPTVMLAGRNSVLASLVDLHDEASRLRVTYSLRKGVSLEVAISLAVSIDQKGTPEGVHRVMSKRSLEAICRIVFPGMAAVAPSLPMMTGATRRLKGQAMDVLGSETPPSTAPRPRPIDPIAMEMLLVAPEGAPAFALDRTLVGLSESGFEVDLVIDVARYSLGAEHTRALAEAHRQLVARTYSDVASNRSRKMLAEVEYWLRTCQPILRVDASLRFPSEAKPTVVSLAEALLFDGTNFDQDAGSRGSDLSSCVRPGARMPNMVVHPLAVAAITEATRRRRPRPPSRDVIRLGMDELDRSVAVEADDLRQHLYIVGQTGVGKSSMLRNLAIADASAGRPVVVVDPHGDLHAELLDALPRSVLERAIIADAGDFDAPFSLNILEVKGPYAAIQRNFIANQLIGLFKSVYGHNPDAFGPMFEAYFRGALFLLMDAGGPDATLLDIERIFGDAPYRRALIENCGDPSVVSFWRNIAQKAGGEAALENIAPYISSKLSQLAGNPLVRPIVCTPQTTLDLPRALAEGRSVLVNLAKGLVGSNDARILGGIITIRLFAAGMERARLPAAERRLTRVILDEFQTYGAVGILAEAMAEVRKYGLSIVLANQSVAQIDGRAGDVAHAILGNAGNLVSFRVGPKDAAMLAEWLGPEVSAETLLRLPNHTCVARLLRDGSPLPPVTLRTA